jgi:hypothetical protein
MSRQTNQLMSCGSHHVPIVVRHSTYILKYYKYTLNKDFFFLTNESYLIVILFSKSIFNRACDSHIHML